MACDASIQRRCKVMQTLRRPTLNGRETKPTFPATLQRRQQGRFPGIARHLRRMKNPAPEGQREAIGRILASWWVPKWKFRMTRYPISILTIASFALPGWGQRG